MLHRIPLAIPFLLLIAAGVFLTGINWGLPTATETVDPFLFGAHQRWSGAQIIALAGPTDDPNRGADVASHPAEDRTGVTFVNATDADRARIIRRYRLMSYQPDEWNTLKALSEMKPGAGNFDPKLYQYGGLWVYPIGAMLKASAMLHLIDLRADVSWYLDHPQAFGRFYIVARLWSVFWALVGVWAIYALVYRIVGGWKLPTTAALCYTFMPVVVNMAHEAKPHLAGAVLMLLAVLAASYYVEQGKRRQWILAGILCGAAVSMVLSTVPIMLILPAMALAFRSKSDYRDRRRSLRYSEQPDRTARNPALRRTSETGVAVPIVGSLALAALVYLITNPYVPINFVFHRAVLASNLGNSQAMYHPQFTASGIANAAYLSAAGTSPVLAIAGVVGAIALGFRAIRVRKNTEPAEVRRRATGLLLAMPALCILGQWIMLATGKPGEFGRFMLLPDLFLMIEAVVALGTIWPMQRAVGSALRTDLRDHDEAVRGAIAIILILTTIIPGFTYIRSFFRDSKTITSRLAEARRLQNLTADGTKQLTIYADPAPYCLPPVDLFDWPIALLPRDENFTVDVNLGEVCVRTVDVQPDVSWFWSLWTATPISWADKPLQIKVFPSTIDVLPVVRP